MSKVRKFEPVKNEPKPEQKQEQKKEETVDFTQEQTPEVVDFEMPALPEYPNLHEAVGKVITIKSIEFRDTRRGRIYYVHCDDGSYYTWSKVIGAQLEALAEKYLSKGIKVRAKVARIKNYLTLASPKG